jgi:myosin heavy subunit
MQTLKVSGHFQAHMCLDQLRDAGLLEVCRIRKAGFPARKDLDEFLGRYKVLLAKGGGKTKSAAELAEALSKQGTLVAGEWQAGKRKLFMRQEQFDSLEAARDEVLGQRVRAIQATARGFGARRRFKGVKTFFAALAAAVKARDAAQLEQALLGAAKPPFQGLHAEQRLE